MLSVIVPVYNKEKYLKRCLDCLVRQSLKNMEILLIDDGSTDKSGCLCDGYAEKYENVKVIHKENGGVSSARNIGIENANGDYIAFMDADDCVDLDCYEILLDSLKKTDSDVSACAILNEYNENYKLKSTQEYIPELVIFNGYQRTLESVTDNNDSIEGFVVNKIWKKTLIGTHRFREDISMCEDLLFLWETLKEAKRACFCNRPMYHYLIQLSGLSHSTDMSKYEGALEAHEIMISDAKKECPDCVTGLIGNHINWIIKTCESMAISDRFDARLYERAKENLEQYKKHVAKSDFRHKQLAKGIMKSWKSYKKKAKVNWYLKTMYIKIKQI